jgi:hypothetical protein
MECIPADNVLVVNVAPPLLRFCVPRVVVPSRKVTVPVGIPAPGADAPTPAVRINGWPTATVFELGASASVVADGPTVCVSEGD